MDYNLELFVTTQTPVYVDNNTYNQTSYSYNYYGNQW